MSLFKAKTKKALKGTGTAAFICLEAVVSAADAFPPLKSTAGGALHIAKLVKGFKSNSNDWDAFGNYVQDHVVGLLQRLPDTSLARKDIRQNIEKLSLTLSSIGKELEELRSKPPRKRIFAYLKDPDKISEMRRRLDEAISVFMVRRNNLTHLIHPYLLSAS